VCLLHNGAFLRLGSTPRQGAANGPDSSSDQMPPEPEAHVGIPSSVAHGRTLPEMSDRALFGVTIKCPDCRQAGSITWEEDDEPTSGKPVARTFVRVSGAFHQEAGRTGYGNAVIVCDVCDTIQDN
jgi:hypothetical protein